jgi:hypothetical protein
MSAYSGIGGPRRPLCLPKDLCEKLTDCLANIQKVRKRPLFVLIVDDIDTKVLDEVCSWRNELRQAAAAGGGLDILIDSWGGTLSDCHLVARAFCRCANSWDALVPKRAVSGATLICLGSAKVVMCETAQLGPLDPQVMSKRPGKFSSTERQSPLEAFRSVKYLRDYSITTLDTMVVFLLGRGVEPKLALETAAKVASDLTRPILEKIEPYDLGSFDLDSQVAIEYCRRVANPSNASRQTQRNVDPDELVLDYPAHEFVIDWEEAAALGFRVELPSPDVGKLFEELRPIIAKAEAFIGPIWPNVGVTDEKRAGYAEGDRSPNRPGGSEGDSRSGEGIGEASSGLPPGSNTEGARVEISSEV